jgi:signal transduction histidine kinase
MPSTIVLNVDDHEPGRYARSRLLTEAGYRVEEAGTGEMALSLVHKLRPAVVLLDIHLPDMSGLDVCRQIRQNTAFAHTPILQISASAVSDPQRVVGLDSGADGYLVEPVDPDVLLATVRALLRMRHAEQELQRVNGALKETNSALEKANAALLRSNEDLQSFSYLASHDLQEPLRTIKSFANLLNRRYGSQLDATALEFLAHIDNASTRMNLLIMDLLAYAQASEEVALNAKDVAVDDVIRAAAANLKQSIQECSAELVVGAMPVVCGNEGQLLQLFQNLIGNALKYRSPDKLPLIRISADKNSSSSWQFSVSDNGLGIAPEHLEIIFAPFKRLHGQEVPGTGIGLSTCRRIVERHGGRIWAESAGPGSGATFFFTLPESEPHQQR